LDAEWEPLALEKMRLRQGTHVLRSMMAAIRFRPKTPYGRGPFKFTLSHVSRTFASASKLPAKGPHCRLQGYVA
jgi:hypothetical protein